MAYITIYVFRIIIYIYINYYYYYLSVREYRRAEADYWEHTQYEPALISVDYTQPGD